MIDTTTMAAIEAILFATGRAVTDAEFAKVLGVEAEEASEICREFADLWNGSGHGTEILRLEDAWQMCTRTEYYPQLITLEMTPKKPRMTDVLLETLSVIAYKQPVTKAEIERIRGVNSDHAVNRLVEYNLVSELGRAKLPGRPILFGTTEDFLRAFGVSSKDTLPEINPGTEEDFLAEAEAEAGAAQTASVQSDALQSDVPLKGDFSESPATADELPDIEREGDGSISVDI